MKLAVQIKSYRKNKKKEFMKALKIVLIGIALLLIQACSHPIEIVGEGDVTSASGKRNCSLGQDRSKNTVCKYYVGIDLATLQPEDYAETYYATPHPDWMFSHWVNCLTTEGAPNYGCSFNVPAAVVQQFWGKSVPALKAVFCLTDDTDCDGLIGDADPCPANPTNPCALITGKDIVTANGREWAQPDLFTYKDELKPHITWNLMNAACPGGKCKVGAILNGKDLTGWTWAGFSDVALLYNSFGASFGASLSTVALDGQYVEGSSWVADVYDAGFRPTLADDQVRTIYVMFARDEAGIAAGIAVAAYGGSQEYYHPSSYDWVGTNAGQNNPDQSYSGAGFLLYRPIP